MLELTRIKPQDTQRLESILRENGIVKCSQENCMAIYDGSDITGIASFDRYESIAILENIAILSGDPGDRLKDGLLRALLNMADLQGIRIFIVEKGIDSAFYEKMGFKGISQREFVLPEELKGLIGDDNKHIYTLLPDFFEQGCKSCNSCSGCNK